MFFLLISLMWSSSQVQARNPFMFDDSKDEPRAHGMIHDMGIAFTVHVDENHNIKVVSTDDV